LTGSELSELVDRKMIVRDAKKGTREGKQVCALLLVVHAACSGLKVVRGVEMIGHGLTSGPRTAARLARPGS
jgi:hypothetical protein